VKDDDPVAQQKLQSIRKYVPRRAFRTPPSSKCPSSAPSSMAGCATPKSPSAPFNAGPRSKNISASCLHGDEYDEQRRHVQRLRSRYRRRGRYACSATGSETPSALLDWNNNYADDPDKAVCFHCSNLPNTFSRMSAWISRKSSPARSAKKIRLAPAWEEWKAGSDEFRALLRRTIGKGRSAATSARAPSPTIHWKLSAAPVVVRIPHLQKLLRYICERGFEHHVAANFSTVASAVHEAATRYLGWDMYWHRS